MLSRMSIDFGKACGDLFATEKKWMTILGLCVCMLIPVAGPMVAFGYLYRRFAREREGKSIEDFEFNFFGEYLRIGLWPVVASLVLSLFLVPIILVAMLPMFIGPLIDPENGVLIAVTMVIGFTLYCVVLVAFTLFCFPVMLRSGLMMDFKAGFEMRFVKSFIRKVGGSLFLYYVLLVMIAIPLSFVGYLALFVGVYVVMAWIQFAMIHLVFQHYDLFLERGGERIEVHPDVTKELGMPPLPTRAGVAPPSIPDDTADPGER